MSAAVLSALPGLNLLPGALPAAATDPIAAPVVDLRAVLPLLIVLGGACLGVLVEAFVSRPLRHQVQVTLTLLTLVAGLGTAIWGMWTNHYAVTFHGAVAVDRAGYLIWAIVLVLAVPSVLLMSDRVTEPGGSFVAQASLRVGSARDRRDLATATPMLTEVFPLTLFAVGGMMTFGVSADLLTLFIALEVMSLPLYLLSGLARRRRLISQEAAVKYFLLGAFTSAILLYGIAMLYGYAGTITLSGIRDAAQAGQGSDALLLLGIGLLVVGLLFKGSVGPFHLWTPDVYQGAPTPVTAFMAACTKVAAFAAMLRIFIVAFEPMTWSWRPVLSVVAVFSMLIGAVLGLIQSDIKRMLAYSSIAHAGFLMLGVMSMDGPGISGTLFYLLTYGIATIGGFAIVTLVRRNEAEATNINDWAGLGKRSPLLAGVMTLFLLSFAGIPLTAGFIGKLTVFSAAMNAGMGWLVVVALLASAITAFFYLRIIVQMYFTDPKGPAEDAPYVVISGSPTTIVIAVCAALTLLLGIVPGPVLDWLTVAGMLG